VLVEVDLGDDGDGEALVGDLAAEVVDHQLLVGGVEAEPRRQVQLRLRVSSPFCHHRSNRSINHLPPSSSSSLKILSVSGICCV